ncbi:hypothetical protein M0R45_021733 [Rubus argutus]|uniref:Uncharacterized protein n=1 Tax=Rubus argutus TaxID=59490 RepID=A0AAW1XEF9_RUBAR
MHDAIGIPACFSAGAAHQRPVDHDPAGAIRSGQSVFMSVYSTKIAGQCRLITITWCKNLLLHGLSVSVQGHQGEDDYRCKVELKPWYFWRKTGSKQFMVDGITVDVVWDLKAAKFNGETEPQSDYYVAIVCEEEVVLLVGDQKKDAYRKTGCRPSLIEPILVSRKEHLFGKRKYSTRINFHEKGKGIFHEILIECNNNNNNSVTGSGSDPELEIKIDGNQAIHVKHLHWKFRGNESVDVNKTKVEVYWDVHDWLFSSGARYGVFIFKPIASESAGCSLSTTQVLTNHQKPRCELEDEDGNAGGSSGFSLFVYAWKVE